MEKLKNACRNARDIALVHFLHATGCRVSEVVSVDVTDVDFRKENWLYTEKVEKNGRYI